MRAEDLGVLVEQATHEDLPRLIGDLEAAKAAAWARINSRSPAPSPALAGPGAGDTNISAKAAALRLGISASYIYKNAHALPFTRRIGGRVVCSAAGVERWDRQRATASKDRAS